MKEFPVDVFDNITSRIHYLLNEIEEDYKIPKDGEKEDYRPEII